MHSMAIHYYAVCIRIRSFLTREIRLAKIWKFMLQAVENMKWGRWTFDIESLSLITKTNNGGKLYYIPLTKCNSSAEILDWIAKLHEKKMDLE